MGVQHFSHSFSLHSGSICPKSSVITHLAKIYQLKKKPNFIAGMCQFSSWLCCSAPQIEAEKSPSLGGQGTMSSPGTQLPASFKHELRKGSSLQCSAFSFHWNDFSLLISIYDWPISWQRAINAKQQDMERGMQNTCCMLCLYRRWSLAVLYPHGNLHQPVRLTAYACCFFSRIKIVYGRAWGGESVMAPESNWTAVVIRSCSCLDPKWAWRGVKHT